MAQSPDEPTAESQYLCKAAAVEWQQQQLLPHLQGFDFLLTAAAAAAAAINIHDSCRIRKSVLDGSVEA